MEGYWIAIIVIAVFACVCCILLTNVFGGCRDCLNCMSDLEKGRHRHPHVQTDAVPVQTSQVQVTLSSPPH